MVAKAHHIERVPTNSDEEAIILETNLIREHTPMYNNLIKGGNSYVYLKIPKEDFPNILLTRYKKNDNAVYIWPKVRRRQLKNTLQIIRSVLKYRSSSAAEFKKWVVSSDYFFWLSEWWCVYDKLWWPRGEELLELNTRLWFTQKYTREEAVKRYKEIVSTIISFFSGDSGPLEDIIKKDIDKAIQQQHFEWAAKLRDVYMSITTISQQVSISLDSLKTWIFLEIHSTASWHFYAVMKIYEGKIIDIITWKEATTEWDILDITPMVELEYKVSLSLVNQTPSTHSFSSFTKKLTKKELWFLEDRASDYINAYIQSNHDQSVSITNELLKDLEERYYFNSFPYLIECTDISHFSGEHTVWAVTRMQAGRIDKSGYRRYRITSTDTGDDYLALEEVISRRFAKQPWPDTFVLDGWVGQLWIINKLDTSNSIKNWKEIRKHTTFVALWKWKARKRKWKAKGEQEYISYFDTKGKIDIVPLRYDTVDRLLILLRDEAHRFANTYRKKRMQKAFEDMTNS